MPLQVDSPSPNRSCDVLKINEIAQQLYISASSWSNPSYPSQPVIQKGNWIFAVALLLPEQRAG